MKKTIGLFFLLVLIVTGLLLVGNKKNNVVLVDGENTPFSVRLHYDMGELTIHPWYEEETGIWYVFFPSYIESHVIDCSNLEYGELYINGEKKNRQFEWQDDTLYEFAYHENEMQIIFLEDENLSSLFIETESGSNDLIRAAKENVEEGHIVSLDHQGNLEYNGKIREISGHGNAWEFYDKRAYDIKLNSKASLGGLEGRSQWKLLHLWNDGDKIHSKLAFDIAKILEADYTPESTWVNVYLNGEYHGMYLLTTAVRDQDVFNTEEAIFLEKDLESRYIVEEHFITQEGNGFVIHRPKEPGEDTKEKISGMVQEVEYAVAEGRLDEELMDIDSFVTQFLVDEITLNSDGFETSSYIYKTTDKAAFCAGPAWDYDGAFGEYLHAGVNNVNPAQSVLDGEFTELTWYQKLYDNPEFLEMVINKYKDVMPELRKLYEETIDVYAEYIRGSVRNDDIRWQGYHETLPRTGTYQTWENNIRYLKYFCMTRYNALMERFGIAGEKLVFETTEELHEVRILFGGKEESLYVPDGEALTIARINEICGRDDGIPQIEYSEEVYCEYVPVLENFAIKVELEASVEETEEGKYVTIPKDIFAQSYDFVSVFIVDSEGNMESVQVAEPLKEDIHLEFGEEESGVIAIYVMSDEAGTSVLEEVMIEY